MSYQHSDATREFGARRPEILSDSTDLDALLAAILGDERTPVTADARPKQAEEPSSEAAVVSSPEPAAIPRTGSTLVAPPRDAAGPDPTAGRSPVTDDDAGAAWVGDLRDFVARVREQDVQAAHGKAVAAEPAYLAATTSPSPAWRDRMPVPTSKQSVLVAGLSAAALITLGAISLRVDQGDRVESPSPSTMAPPAAMPSAPIVEPISPASSAVTTVVEVTAPARKTTAAPRVTPPSPTRANVRTAAAPSEASQRTLRATVAPAAEAPIAVPPIAAELDPVVVAPLIAVADTAPPTFVKPAPAPVAPPAVTSGADAAAAASVPSVGAAVARRTPPRLLTGGTPDYPAALRTARVGGNVEVRFTVDSTGRVVNVQAVTGPPQLRPVAEAAVRRWRYEPAHVGNVAVETQTSVSFNFDPSTIRRPQE